MTRLPRFINLPALSLGITIVLTWQAIVAWKIINFTYVPRPTSIAAAIGDLLGSSEFYRSVGFTLGNGLIGVAIATVVAIPLGVVLALSAVLRTYTMASLDLLRHVPLIALFPVALLVWGPTRKAEIILATFASVWPILLNVMSGIANVPTRLLEVSRVFRLSRTDTLRRILLPATLTATVVGLRLAIVTGFLVAIVAEMLVSGHGLGWDFVVTQLSLNASKLWALAILAGVIGYILNVVLERAIGSVWPYYALANNNRAE